MSLLVARRGAIASRRGSGGGGVTTYADEVAADSPVAWWRLGETAGSTFADEQSATDGDVFGANLNVSGPTGNGALLDGVDDYLDTNRQPLPSTCSALSVEALMRITTDHTAYGIQSYRGASGRGWAFVVRPTRKIEAWTTRSGGSFTQNALSVDNVTTVGQWAHVAFTWSTSVDSGRPQLYFNGGEVGYDSRVAETTAMSLAADVLIGQWTSSLFFSGDFAEVAIYDKVLSSGRLLAHTQAAGLA